MPVIYVFIDRKDKDFKFKSAVLYIGLSQILIPPEKTTTVSILTLLIKAHHIFQVGYTPANEVLALIVELAICGFKKNETDCKPNPTFEKLINSIGYFLNCYECIHY